jgi:hypothetical protein
VEKYDTDGEATYGIIKWPMRIACWVTKATDTHIEYVILFDFAWKLWLRERASTAT